MGTRWVRFIGFLIPCRGWGDGFGPFACVWERNALRNGCRNRTSIAIVKYSLFKLFIFKKFGLSGVCLYRFCGKLVAEVLQVKALILFCVFGCKIPSCCHQCKVSGSLWLSGVVQKCPEPAPGEDLAQCADPGPPQTPPRHSGDPEAPSPLSVGTKRLQL